MTGRFPPGVARSHGPRFGTSTPARPGDGQPRAPSRAARRSARRWAYEKSVIPAARLAHAPSTLAVASGARPRRAERRVSRQMSWICFGRSKASVSADGKPWGQDPVVRVVGDYLPAGWPSSYSTRSMTVGSSSTARARSAKTHARRGRPAPGSWWRSVAGDQATVDRDPCPGRFLLTGSARLLGLRSLPDALPGRAEDHRALAAVPGRDRRCA